MQEPNQVAVGIQVILLCGLNQAVDHSTGLSPGRTWSPFWRWSHLPMPTECPEPVSPVPAAWYIALPSSDRRETSSAETAWCNNTRQLPPASLTVSLWAASAVPRQVFSWHEPSSAPPECSPAACGSFGSHLRAAIRRSP